MPVKGLLIFLPILNRVNAVRVLKNTDSTRIYNTFFPKRKKTIATVKYTPGAFWLNRSRYNIFPLTIIHP